MAEYFTLHSATPLRVLPTMGIMYFAKDVYGTDERRPMGYFVKSTHYKDVEVQMAVEIANGGDLSFFTLSSGRLALQVTDARGVVKICNTMWDLNWKKLMMALPKIQKFVKGWLFRHRLTNSNSKLKVLREFKSCLSERDILPQDLIMEILRACVNDKTAPAEARPLTRIETSSFAEIYALSD